MDGDFPGGLEFLEGMANEGQDTFGGGGNFGADMVDMMNLGDMVSRKNELIPVVTSEEK